MAYIDSEGYLQCTEEDKEALRGGTGKDWAKNIINKVIWGKDKHFYEENIKG